MRAAFYARVSSDEQAEQGNIQNQVQFAERYFELHAPEHGIEAYDVYLDEGVSGSVPFAERPKGSELLANLGRYGAVYVYRLDRLARSVKVFIEAYEAFEKRGVALKSMTEPFDTGSPTGRFFMTLLISIAALERETIVERTQLGKWRKAKEGGWVAGPPPFGYRVGPGKKLVVEESEAETVRLIFRLYLEGMSTIEVARYLNARGIPTPAVSKGTRNRRTGRWYAGHISIILRTEAYAGTYVYYRRSKRGRELLRAEVPPLISREDFEAVRTRLRENADNARASRGRRYLLRGLIFCGNCGRAMVGTTGDSKGGRVYYRCSGAADAGAGKRCRAKLIRAKDIEGAVWEDIREFLRNPGAVADLLQAQLERGRESLAPLERELAEAERAVSEAQAARARVLSLCARGLVTMEEAGRELAALGAEAAALAARRDAFFARLESLKAVQARALDARLLLERLARRLDALDEEDRSSLVRGLVERVDVFTEEADGIRRSRAVIRYRFCDPGKDVREERRPHRFSAGKALCGSRSLRRCSGVMSVSSGTSFLSHKRAISKLVVSP